MFGTARRDRAFKDYCLILQVHPEADAAMVDAAYWHLAKRYNAATAYDPQAKAKLEELNEAYIVLGSAEKREAYMKVRTQVLGEGALPQAPGPMAPAPPLAVMSRQRPQERGSSEAPDEGSRSGLGALVAAASRLFRPRSPRGNPRPAPKVVESPGGAASAGNYRREQPGQFDKLKAQTEQLRSLKPKPPERLAGASAEPGNHAEPQARPDRAQIDKMRDHVDRLRAAAKAAVPATPIDAQGSAPEAAPLGRAEIEQIKRETEAVRRLRTRGDELDTTRPSP